MLLLAFALSYLAMLALSMAMSRHHKALFTVAASPARQRLLRPLAGLLLVALLAWRARWVLPLAAALPLAAGLGTLL